MIRTAYSMILFLVPVVSMTGQTEHYSVKKAAFCSEVYDEYAPVPYKGGIVFCSTRSNRLFLSFRDRGQKNLAGIYYAVPGEGWKNTRPLDPVLTTPFNDGPATFNAGGNLIFFSRNLNTGSRPGNRVDRGNVLGLYHAGLLDGEWMNVRPFPYNDTGYSLTMPALDSSGTILIFASDMPGGYGGTDLYLSRYNNGGWSRPRNLGAVVNSGGNEVYPFLTGGGVLYFASDRPGGFGNKDIYRSDSANGVWTDPVHLEAPINSVSDDFGMACDDRFERGWFSSDRDRTDDIYFFETLFPPFYACDSLQKNHYCYLFNEENYSRNDSVSIRHEWTFSDGTFLEGIEVEHCFPGPGSYSVKLRITQTYEGEEFVTETTREFELKDHEQAVIRSADSCMVNDTVRFDGLGYNLPGFTAEAFFWEFGDGTLEKGPVVSHVYTTPGTYRVQLGLRGRDRSGTRQENCICKMIRVMEPGNDRRVEEPGEQLE